MGKTIKDTQYLAISAQIRAMETGLLRREQMEQLLSADSEAEAVKLVRSWGYPDLESAHPKSIDAALSADREAVFRELSGAVPDARYVDIFRLKYDYHNIKALIKGRAMGVDASHMLLNQGRIAADELQAAYTENRLDDLPETVAAAVKEAEAVLASTRDPQLSDLVLDRRYYEALSREAQETGSAFLQGYVRLRIDAANLRAVVRTIRMGKGTEFLSSAVLENGNVGAESLVSCAEAGGKGLAGLYSTSALRKAAEEAETVLRGGALTAFEKLCDEAESEYLAGAQFVPFGEAPVLAYLAAKETEYTNLRILLMGRMAGLDADVIRSRLRSGSM